MKLLVLPFSVILLLVIGVSRTGSSELVLSIPSADGLSGLARPGGRSLLSLPKHVSSIGAALDGTVSLRDGKGSLLWKLATGPPIYSSYRAPLNQDNEKENNGSEPSNRFSIECGNDWELYGREHFVKMKLDVSIEEFVKNSPYISDEGAVTLGSKTTTVFVVEAKTGRLIRTYRSPDISSPLQRKEGEGDFSRYDKINKDLVDSGLTDTVDKDVHLLFITRTDYALQSFSPNSDKVSWSMTVADIGYAFLCQDVKNPFITATLNTSYEAGPEIGNAFEMPFACQSKGIVQRFWEHDKLDSSIRAHNDKSMPLSLPTSTDIKMLPSDTSESVLPDKVPESHHHDKSEAAVVFPRWIRMLSNYTLIILFIVIPVVVVYHNAVGGGVNFLLNGYLSNSNFKSTNSKRRKNRRSGRSKNLSSEDEDGIMDLNKLIDGGAEGRKVGKLFVSSQEIAKGSNGTVVLEGVYGGRRVAVKRLVKAHHDVAFKEVQNLIASDQHPNIVRWYGVENDEDFVYLALERCSCSLDDMIQIYSDSFRNSICHGSQLSRAMIEYKCRLDSLKTDMQDPSLWKASGHPSSVLLKLMRDVVSGLAHLHELGIIHRDLKPQNVLIIKERSLCAKLSDMGISRRLLGDMSSLGHHATGCGSSGWQAPEQLLHGRQTRAVDLFSLGCVLFFCITGGRHPFGDHLERDVNITKNKVDLFLLKCIPEAEDLVSHLLNPDPQLRPSAMEVLEHPLFWSSETRLSFLRDASDRVELEDRETNSALLKALENVGSVALGVKWNEKMEPIFINNIGHYRHYRYDSVRDLLRVVRNKLNHYRELPQEIQELVGPVPDGFDDYFAKRFPRLLIEVYKVVCGYCKEEECFKKYFRSNIV